MKNKSVKLVITTVSTALVLAGCGGLGKMVKNANQLSYEVKPKPLEMHADSVTITIVGKYPEKFFAKKAQVKVTPILKYGDKEKEFKTVTYKGEKSTAEGTVVNFDKGGAITYTDRIAYTPEMRVSELMLKSSASIKKKSKDFAQVKIADGVIATPALVMNDDKPTLGVDQFVKTTPRIADAKIQFVIQQSQVRSTELSKPDVKALADFMKNGQSKGYIFKNVEISAYASPDGEERLNEGLAQRRAEETANYLIKEFKKQKLGAASTESFFQKSSTPEDWEGFKTLVQNSEIQDKDLILRVLSMYTDPLQREQEIKNMAATYTVIADKILPDLRRSKIRINAEEKSRTDDQISHLVTTTPDSLSLEEILYAATLTEDLDAKLNIYKTAERIYSEDWRSSNNAGYVLILQNKLSDAKSQLEKADKLSANNNIVKNNLGVVAHLQGDRKKAEELYKQASASDNNAKYNLGIVNIKNGDYALAVINMSGSNSFNAALAHTLAGNNDAALKAIEASPDKDSAIGYYLKAVIAARSDKAGEVARNLKAAVSKDASLKEKAKTDLEFAKFKTSAEFISAVN